MIESIGLNVIAFEPDSLALTRALLAPEDAKGDLIIDMGNVATDLVIAINGLPRLIRSIPTGADAVVRAAAQNLNVNDDQAKQFVYKFGLNQQKLEGQVFHAISGTIDLLMGEIEKSIKFFTTRYANEKIEKIIVTGTAATLPEFPVFLADKTQLPVEIGNAWRKVVFSQDRQNELLAISNQFAVAVGLAERDE